MAFCLWWETANRPNLKLNPSDPVLPMQGGVTLLTRKQRMAATKITVMNNGSLRVEGDEIQIVDQDGNPFGLKGRTKVSLCRCGQSANKPFCDSAHKTCGFVSQVV